MDYYQIGFSNIRLTDDDSSYTYQYHSTYNTFPEEVFIHEFIHTIERNEQEYGNENFAALHDYIYYGLDRNDLESMRKWYSDYSLNKITDAQGNYVGLTEDAYNKPINSDNFIYSYEIQRFKDPSNVIEVIISIVDRMKILFL